MEVVFYILIFFGLKDPPPPTPICYGKHVWLLYENGIQPTWKECADEPCVIYPRKRKINRELP
jgi:hypothetical protein